MGTLNFTDTEGLQRSLITQYAQQYVHGGLQGQSSIPLLKIMAVHSTCHVRSNISPIDR